jgi:SAM-dependent methyltransferase
MVVGLDIDAGRLEVAAGLWREQIDAGAIDLRQGDVNGLPFDSGTFDIAWASNVLHHEDRPVETLRELARVVRPGGWVALLDSDISGSFPFLPWPPELEQRLRAAYLRGEQDAYGGTLPYFFAGYMGRSLPRLLREAGLADARLEAFADVDRAPLDPQRAAYLRDWFTRPFAGRLRDYLAPRDYEQLTSLFAADAPDDLLTSPDFFLVRMYVLVTGRVQETR